jgi:coatomer subunit beta'
VFCGQVFWNESGELVCIATEESFFILRYKPGAVEKARQTPDGVTEDGVEEAFDVSGWQLATALCGRGDS